MFSMLVSIARESVLSDLNKHIEEFLEYYCNLSHAPQYAVLIKGSWGAGKTHLVKRFFERYATKYEKKEDRKLTHLYVSLYGIVNTREIEDAFFTQMHPVLSSKGMRLAGKVAKGLLKTSLKIDLDGDGKADGSVSQQIPDIDLPDYIKNAHSVPLVFDDIERCSMPIKDILGYINSFVEHDDCKVIILGDEDKISKDDKEDKASKDDKEDKTSEDNKEAYDLIKEKLIGKTFEVRPEFEDAFHYFLETIDNENAKRFYESKLSDIRLLLDQSKSQNLRTLQRTMWDFERFSSFLTETHLANDEAMTDIFRIYFALSFEIKTGRINHKEIVRFSQNYWADVLSSDGDNNPTTTEQLGKRYPEVPFDQTLLSHEILSDVLGNSIIDKTTIYESLDRHQYFSTPETEPTWRILWDATRRDQEFVAKTIIKFEDQFTNREFTLTGEILHVAGIRLWLAEIEAINISRNEVIQEMKIYVDELYQAGQLESTKNKFALIERYNDAFGGLQFHEVDADDFKQFAAYLRGRQAETLEKSYPDKAAALMKEMVEDVDLYFQRLCVNNSDKQLYYETPILSYVEPHDFVDKLLSLPPKNQHTAISVFKPRYEISGITKNLTSEISWLRDVMGILKERGGQMPAISKHGITRWIEWYIEPSLDKLSELALETPLPTASNEAP